MSASAERRPARFAFTAPATLLLLGLLQMAGDLLDVPALKGLGAASGASPAPRVFSSVAGLETYSTRFSLEWTERSGATRVLRLTPELYSRLRGPYARRNVYGAALAYGPVLVEGRRTRSLYRSVVGYALCDPAPVLRELGIDPANAAHVRLLYEPVGGTEMGSLARVLEAPCP
jgi:hypothetical protein